MRRSQDPVVVGAPVPSLASWGHTPEADLVYRTLVTFGPAASYGLGRQLGLPIRRITAALDELTSLGAISRRGGRSRQAAVWAAEPPAAVLPALRHRRPAVPALGIGPADPDPLVNRIEQQGEPAGEPWESADPLSQRERALITLLARGHTDASAARRMHISPRSVTTILRGLMDRFGAENRFQLGLALGACCRGPNPPIGRYRDRSIPVPVR